MMTMAVIPAPFLHDKNPMSTRNFGHSYCCTGTRGVKKDGGAFWTVEKPFIDWSRYLRRLVIATAPAGG
jgi:hypothetical protein